MKELWKSFYVENYGYIYVSNYGNVKNKKHKLLSKRQKQDKLNPYYYIRVNYTKDNIRKIKNIYIHRLVAKCFVKNPLNKMEVNHIDSNKLNNNYKNLEWCTRKENMKHAKENNLISCKKGINNGRSVLKENDVINIRRIKNDMKVADIAKMYNVGWSTIYNIIKGNTWTHLNK